MDEGGRTISHVNDLYNMEMENLYRLAKSYGLTLENANLIIEQIPPYDPNDNANFEYTFRIKLIEYILNAGYPDREVIEGGKKRNGAS